MLTGNPIPPDRVNFDGGANADTLAFVGTATADSVIANAESLDVGGAKRIDHTNVDNISIDGRGGFDAIAINSTTPVVFPTSQYLQSLTMATGASAALAASGDKVLASRSLTLAPFAVLDLNDNDLILDYTGESQRAAIQFSINAARAGGTWAGSGITSSLAKNANPKNTTLGALEASEFKLIYGDTALFAGQQLDTSSVLVKYTYYGDTDFNGVVDFDDYSRIDAGFNNNRTGWLNGDVDGNGIVDFDDYSLIDQAFNTQGAALRPALPALGGKPSKGGHRGAIAVSRDERCTRVVPQHTTEPLTQNDVTIRW